MRSLNHWIKTLSQSEVEQIELSGEGQRLYPLMACRIVYRLIHFIKKLTYSGYGTFAPGCSGGGAVCGSSVGKASVTAPGNSNIRMTEAVLGSASGTYLKERSASSLGSTAPCARLHQLTNCWRATATSKKA
jgi:hypothetical protein